LMQYSDWYFDNFAFVIHELFLYTVGLLLKHERRRDETPRACRGTARAVSVCSSSSSCSSSSRDKAGTSFHLGPAAVLAGALLLSGIELAPNSGGS
jgi:hypothetical protein